MPAPKTQDTTTREMDEKSESGVHPRGKSHKSPTRVRSFVERRKDYNARVIPLPKSKEVIEK